MFIITKNKGYLQYFISVGLFNVMEKIFFLIETNTKNSYGLTYMHEMTKVIIS